MHPDFPGIIDDTIALRNHYFPNAKISVLSNATYCHQPAVHEALRRVDNNILKLDTLSNEYITLVDRPVLKYDAEEMVERLCAFEGKVQVQTLFMSGEYQGQHSRCLCAALAQGLSAHTSRSCLHLHHRPRNTRQRTPQSQSRSARRHR